MRGTELRKLELTLRLTGIAVLGVGVLTGFADLKGWLRDGDREAFLQWALQSSVGMPIGQSSAQAFMKRFPPPEDARISDITHITKQVERPERGPVLQAAFNYMHSDHSRTAYVATLADVREWAAESPYPWVSWLLTVIGFLEVLGSTGIQWRRERSTTAL